MAQFNKYGVDVSGLVANGYKGDIDLFKDQSAIDSLDITGTGNIGSNNPMGSYLGKEGLFGLTNNTWGNLGQAAGLAGTGYGLYDSIWGNKAKLFKEQLGMLKEQRAANQEMLANKRKFNETWSNSSNSLAASGLNKGL